MSFKPDKFADVYLPVFNLNNKPLSNIDFVYTWAFS